MLWMNPSDAHVQSV